MSEHVLKIHEQPFNDLLSGEKTAEIRNNDRGFQVGDTVQLHEIADSYTGRVMHRQVTHVQTGYGLPDGLCVLSYAPLISTLKAGQGEAVEPYAWFWSHGSDQGVLTLRQDYEQHLADYPGMAFTAVYTAPPAKKESGHYSDQDWINAGCPRNEESE